MTEITKEEHDSLALFLKLNRRKIPESENLIKKFTSLKRDSFEWEIVGNGPAKVIIPDKVYNSAIEAKNNCMNKEYGYDNRDR